VAKVHAGAARSEGVIKIKLSKPGHACWQARNAPDALV
jgi:hypothetical protein